MKPNRDPRDIPPVVSQRAPAPSPRTPQRLPGHAPEVLAVRVANRATLAEQLANRTPLPPSPTHALYWNGSMLRPHPSAAAAQADLDDCLKRRTADVKRALPVGTKAGQVLQCSLCNGATDHSHAKHHDEHIGVFEVRPYVNPGSTPA